MVLRLAFETAIRKLLALEQSLVELLLYHRIRNQFFAGRKVFIV